MAGIGYTLRNLIREDRYISDFKANLYCLIISSGPWLCAILCITALLIFTGKAKSSDLIVFRVIAVYVYAFSLIFSSLFQLILTRFMSDKLYEREYSSLLPNFIGVLILCGFLNFSVSSLYMWFTSVNFLVKVLSVILFCVIGYQWIIMVFLSTVRDYVITTLIFFLGFILSFFAAFFLGFYTGLPGYTGGFLMGQILVLLLLIWRIVREFPMGKDKIFAFTLYFKKYPPLLWAAFLYNFGYWLDKIILWWSPYGSGIADNSFRYNYPYDTALFVSILTIIPAAAIFFLQIETEFYEELRKYINTILNRGNYNVIEKKRTNLLYILKVKMMEMIEFQFLITVIVALLSPQIIDFFGFNKSEVLPVFLIVLLASFFQILFLNLLVLLWYFELLYESVFCAFLFTLLNGTLTYIQLYYMSLPLGTSYLMAITVTFIVTLIIFIYRLKDLNYRTFVKSGRLKATPLPMPKF